MKHGGHKIICLSEKNLLPKTWFPVSNNILQQQQWGSLEKWLILGLRQEIHKMSLEHLATPEREEVLKKQNNEVCVFAQAAITKIIDCVA